MSMELIFQCDHRNIEIDKKGVIAISHKAVQFLVKIIVFYIDQLHSKTDPGSIFFYLQSELDKGLLYRNNNTQFLQSSRLKITGNHCI